jgi:hypothetical protein
MQTIIYCRRFTSKRLRVVRRGVFTLRHDAKHICFQAQGMLLTDRDSQTRIDAFCEFMLQYRAEWQTLLTRHANQVLIDSLILSGRLFFAICIFSGAA